MLKKIPVSLKQSLQYGYAAVTLINTVAGVIGYTIRDISEKLTVWNCLFILLIVYTGITSLLYFIIKAYRHRNYKTKINGKPVTIKVGDLLEKSGWKVIPFNEFFDT